MSRKVFASLAELFFTASALVLLFLIYQLWFTTEVAKLEQAAVADRLTALMGAAPESEVSDPVAEVIATSDLSGVGLLYIPALKDQVWGLPIISGTNNRALAQGVGHYQKTELPGQVGNFAIAGHRATDGEPFAYFEKLKAGDLVYVQTTAGWFTYQLVQDQKILETEVWVLDDDPIGLGEQKLITLTTCDPRWNSTRRWAWWGVQIAVSAQAPAEVVN